MYVFLYLLLSTCIAFYDQLQRRFFNKIICYTFYLQFICIVIFSPTIE